MKTPILAIFSLSLSVMVCASPLIVAHRGASKDAPENTVPAFELAWKQEADAIEGDFHLTSDGEIVCIHDKDTSGVSKTKMIVRYSTLEQLRELDVGEWFGETWKGTRIPTIAEVFRTIPEGRKIYIEIKCGPEILPKLYQELKSSGLKREQVVIITFNLDVIHKIKLSAPSINAFLLSGFVLGRDGGLEPTADNALNAISLIKADGFSSYGHDELSKEYVARIVERGIQFNVWTIDDIEKARRFSDMGVHSITTNRPGYIKRGLNDYSAVNDKRNSADPLYRTKEFPQDQKK